MKKLFLSLLLTLFSIGLFAQVTNKDIEIRKTTPVLKLNGTSAQINFYNGDLTLTQSSDKLTLAGGNFVSINNLLGYSSTATASGTTVLTVASNYMQFFTGTLTQTVTLPVVTTLTLGQEFNIINNSTGLVTVNASGGDAAVVLAGGTSAKLKCILVTGTTSASWDVKYFGISIGNGRKLSVGATLTLTGTDATTMTFPTTSATIARTDAANTFTGVQSGETAAPGTNTTQIATTAFTYAGLALKLNLADSLLQPNGYVPRHVYNDFVADTVVFDTEEITEVQLVTFGDTTVTEVLGRFVYKTSNGKLYVCIYIGSAHPSWLILN
jgi:hypothetical protein